MPTCAENSARALRLSCIVGGICLGLSYPPVGLFPLGWFALAPAFVGILGSDRRRAFINAWLLYLAGFSVAFYWPLFHVRLDTSIVSGVAWVAITMLHALPFGLGASLSQRIKGTSAIWITGAMILLVEWLLTAGPLPMPWSVIGNSQAASTEMVLPSRWIGVSGLSVLLVLTNLCAAIAFLLPGRPRKAAALTAIGLPIAILLSGALHSDRGTATDTPLLRVGILQPGFSPESWASVHDFRRLDSLFSLSGSFLDGSDESIDILVWPETALPPDTQSPDSVSVFRKVTDWVIRYDQPLLTGGITDLELIQSGTASQTTGGYENSVLFFQPSGSIQRSGKNILVPLAEHVPFSEVISALNELSVPAGGVSGYVPDTTPSVFSFGDTSFGVVICFESVFPSYARELALAGSNFLVAITQDGWWRGMAGYYQHLYFNRIRSMELGLPVVQVGVDGISALLLPDGQIQQATVPGTRATAVFEISPSNVITGYRRFGDAPALIALGIWILISLLHAIRSLST